MIFTKLYIANKYAALPGNKDILIKLNPSHTPKEIQCILSINDYNLLLSSLTVPINKLTSYRSVPSDIDKSKLHKFLSIESFIIDLEEEHA